MFMNSPSIDCILFNEKLKVFSIWTRIAAKMLFSFYSYLMWKLPRAPLENPSTLYRFRGVCRGHGGDGGGNEIVWEWLISSAYERQFINQQITDFVLRIFHADSLKRQHSAQHWMGKIENRFDNDDYQVTRSVVTLGWKKCQKNKL